MTNALVEKVLFHNHFTDDKYEEPLANMKENTPYIKMDLNYMSTLLSD